ncbi:hypothetical protein G6F68_011509 [Rhizopus microsporus]|nr:hypothetical protein G6F68_011509 [Rhizopus microsporus]
MGGELFKSMAKLDVMFIPYNGGPAAIQDLLGGRLDYLFVNTSEATPLVKSGKVRAIGVSSLKRLSLMPDVPTLDESGLKGYETVAWGGVVAPKEGSAGARSAYRPGHAGRRARHGLARGVQAADRS